MLAKHGFSYAGNIASQDRTGGDEDHYFTRSDCTLLFSFAYNINFGANSASIGDPIQGRLESGRFENFLYFFEYYEKLNELIHSGSTRNEGLAIVLDEHIEYAAKLYSVIKSNGHRIPSADDRAQARA